VYNENLKDPNWMLPNENIYAKILPNPTVFQVSIQPYFGMQYLHLKLLEHNLQVRQAAGVNHVLIVNVETKVKDVKFL
jgi:hypothetical protein